MAFFIHGLEFSTQHENLALLIFAAISLLLALILYSLFGRRAARKADTNMSLAPKKQVASVDANEAGQKVIRISSVAAGASAKTQQEKMAAALNRSGMAKESAWESNRTIQ